MAPTARLAEKLKLLGLTTDDNPASTPKATVTSRKKLTFKVFFPLPPLESGLHFNALKAGHGTFNFTGLLLGVGGKQLQKIKQESNARVEVVNAYGNLNGTHPDPLDEDLHALVTADSMAKLQRAVDLVVQVLSPTNGCYESFKVEPGGSARLRVGKQSSGKSTGASAKPKLTKPLPPVSSSSSGSRSRASLDGGSSSCSTKGMPPSPALTPVTPAATSSRHGSMFASGSSGPSSCSSSRTPTPSPSVINARCSRCSAEPHSQHTHTDCSGAAGSGMSGDGGSKDTHSHLEGFQLPPAALPTAPQAAFLASEWPALPSSQDNSSSSTSTSTTTTSSSSSSNIVSKPGLSAGVGTAGHSQSTSAIIADSRRGDSNSSSNPKAVQPSVEYVSIPMSHLRLQPLDVQQPVWGCDSPQGPPQVTKVSTGGLSATNEHATEQQAGDSDSGCVSSVPVQQQSVLTYAGQAPAVLSGDCDDVKEYALLSPLTPQAQQYQHQQKAQQRLRQPGAEQEQGSQAMLQPSAQTGGTGGVFGLGLDWQPAADSSSGSSCAVACLPSSALQHGPSHCQQLNPLQQQQPCDLDLLMLRQRAGLLSQAYLHCDGSVGGVSCACAGIAAAPAALCVPYPCSDSPVSLLGPSTGAIGAAVQEGFDGSGLATQYGHQQLQDDFACQEYQRQQHEQHMRVVAGAAAAVNYSSWDGCSSLSSSMPPGPLPQLAATGGGQAGSLPHLGWELTDYASRAQTAAVAAAASAAFGGPGMTDTGVAGDVLSSTCWEGGAGALTASGFLASNSIW